MLCGKLPNKPAVFAHRGDWAQERENTIGAFRAAVEAGADGIELDVRITRDGRLVVHHDPLIEQVAVSRMIYPNVPEWIPSLTDALDACYPLRVNIEVKVDDAASGLAVRTVEALNELLRVRAEAPENWVISSFDSRALDHMRFLNSNFRLGLLCWKKPWQPSMEHAVNKGYSALHPHEGLVDAELIESASAAGIELCVWTVNDPKRARGLAAAGVTSLITDMPAVIRNSLNS